MAPKVQGKKSCPITQKVLIAAEYAEIKVDFKEAAADEKVTVHYGGAVIAGSSTCARFFARMRPDVGLYGRTFLDAASVDGWLEFLEKDLEVPLQAWNCLKASSCPHTEGCVNKIKEDVHKALQTINEYLLHETFLAGDRFSLADIALVCSLHQAVQALDANLISAFPNVSRWFATASNQANVKKVLTASGAQKGGAATKKSEKSEKSEKPKVQKPAVEDEEEKPAPKKKNPLDDLPPSKLNLDEWKRMYSNNPLDVAMKWFWEHVDYEGYSFWTVKYDKLEGEGKIAYQFSNLFGGYQQRIPPDFRKYSFGVTDIIGKDGNFDIKGVWMLRGQTLPEELASHEQRESFPWTKMDIKDPKTTALVNGYWTECDAVEGLPIEDSKVWK